MTEDEMVGWHHQHEFEQALGDGETQGSLVCCSPWGHKESDTTERLNNNNDSMDTSFCHPLYQKYFSLFFIAFFLQTCGEVYITQNLLF